MGAQDCVVVPSPQGASYGLIIPMSSIGFSSTTTGNVLESRRSASIGKAFGESRHTPRASSLPLATARARDRAQ
jgi:hypothetical protein